MVRTPRRLRVALATGLVTLSLTAFAGSVSAAPGPTPNEFTGACNMVASWPGAGPAQGVGVQPGGGMENAMFGTPAYERLGDDHKGNLGMSRAVGVSGGSC
jgi:hypothetical protein